MSVRPRSRSDAHQLIDKPSSCVHKGRPPEIKRNKFLILLAACVTSDTVGYLKDASSDGHRLHNPFVNKKAKPWVRKIGRQREEGREEAVKK